MTIGIVALVVAVLNIAWVVWWSWWTYRNAVRVGYDKALHDREALVDLAANLASRYAISVDEATTLVHVGLRPPAALRPARPWWGTYEDPAT